MNHEQLLQKVTDDFFFTQGLGHMIHYNTCVSDPCHCSAIDETHLKLKQTMLALLELHKPDVRGGCNTCSWIINGFVLYEVCPTIQTIKKELL